MLTISFYSAECAELIHTYVELHAEEYCELWDIEKLSEMEFVLRDFECFRSWAQLYDIDVRLDSYTTN